MSGTGYDNAQGLRTYRFPAVSVSDGAVVGRVIGPAGKVGRVVGLEYVVTTGITVAAAGIIVDTNAGLTGPLTVSAPIASAAAGGTASKAELKAGAGLPADTVVELSNDGAATAGAADVALTIQWY